MQTFLHIAARRDISSRIGGIRSIARSAKTVPTLWWCHSLRNGSSTAKTIHENTRNGTSFVPAVSCDFVDHCYPGGKKVRRQTKTLLRISLCILAIGLFLSTETSAATVTNRVTGAANWNTAATWIQNRAGTVTFTNLSKNVTGVGTQFTSELTGGDTVMLQTSAGIVRGIVGTITNDTQLILQANATATISGAYGRQQVPGSSDDVVIGNTNLPTPAVTITLDISSATVNSLTFSATTVANSLTHSGTNALTVSNNVTVNQPTASVTVAWNINGGTGAVNGNVAIGGANTTAGRVARIAVTSGSLSLSGAVNYTANTTAATQVITVSTGSISFSNALTLSSGTLSVTSTGTINLNGGLSFGGSTPSFSTVANSNINFAGNLSATTNALTLNATSTTTFTANATITPTAAITFGHFKVNSSVTATLAGGVTVAGNLTIDGTLGGVFTTTLSVAATTIAANNGTVAGSISTVGAHAINAGTVLTVQTDFAITGAAVVTNNGSVTIQGNLTGSVAGSTWTNAASSSLTVRGTVLPTGTLIATANPNTVTYNSTTAAQTVKGTTYHDLVINKSGQTGTLGAATIVTDDLTVSAGTLSTAALTLGVAGNFVVNGTLSGTGAITLSGASKNIDGTGSITNTTTLTINAAHTILATASLSFSGTIAISGAVTVTNNGAVTTSAVGGITGSVAGSTWTNANGSALNLAGPLLATGTLNASVNSNTVNYNGAAQTVKATTYHHLILSGSAAKTAGGAVTVNGDFTISGSTTFAAGTSLTHTFLGNWIVNTTAVTPFSFTTASTINFNTPGTPAVTSLSGTSAATIGFNSVNLNNTSGFSSTENFSITGTLTVAANVTFTPAAGAIVSGAGTLTGSGTVKVTRTAATPDFNSQYSISNKTLANLTVDYDATAAQTVNALNYFNLTISNNRGGAAVTLAAGTVGISGLFDPNATNVSYTTTGNTVVYNGTTAQTVIAFNYNNLTSSSTGARTLAGSGTIGVAGTFTPGPNSYTIAGSTVDFNGSGAQTIPVFKYDNLTSSSIGARTLAGGGAVSVAGTFTPGTNSYTITGSTIDFNGAGAQTIPAFNYNNLISSSAGARTLANSGTIGVADTFTPGANSYTITGSTVDFNGSGAQTIPAFNYNNLTSSSAGARTLANSGTIGIAATFTPGPNTFTITASTIDFNGSGAQTIPAFNYYNLTSSSSGPRTLANSGTIGIAATFTPGPNTFTITASTIDFNGAGAQTIPAFGYNNLTISGSRSANNVTFASSGTIGVVGTLSDTATFNSGSGFITTGSTVDYNGTGSQSVTALSPLVGANNTYNNLTISNTASPVSAGTSFSVGGTVNANANVTFSPAAAVVISGAGTLTGSGTVQVTRATGSADFANQYAITNKTLTNLTVEFAGAAAQATDARTFGGLKINNSSGVTLSGSVTVNGTLTLSSGNITTAANNVIVSSTGTVSRTSGYVVGNLQKNVATGATSSTFEVGDAGNYTPVSVSFASVTAAGDLTVNTTTGDHPNIASSTTIPSKSVNRYWTLTNNGIVFTTYSATFNFVSGDVDAGADPNTFVVGKFASAAWTYPVVGVRTPTSTEATGLSTFSDFQLGEGGTPNVKLDKDVTPSGDQEPGTDLTYSVTFTNIGSIAAQSLVITDPNPNNVDVAARVFVDLDYKLGSAAISSPWIATIEFSNDGGATWSYTPVSEGGGAPAGYDRTVTNIRWSVTGNLATSATGSVSFISRIR